MSMIDKGWLEALILISIIAIDVCINWYIIRVRKKEPNHFTFWLVRILIVSILVKEDSIVTTLVRTLNAGIVYWFLFNIGLNKARKKDIDYIGVIKYRTLKETIKKYDGSFSLIDQVMLHTLPPIVWFVFIGISAIFCFVNMLYNYNPYGNFLS